MVDVRGGIDNGPLGNSMLGTFGGVGDMASEVFVDTGVVCVVVVVDVVCVVVDVSVVVACIVFIVARFTGVVDLVVSVGADSGVLMVSEIIFESSFEEVKVVVVEGEVGVEVEVVEESVVGPSSIVGGEII